MKNEEKSTKKNPRWFTRFLTSYSVIILFLLIMGAAIYAYSMYRINEAQRLQCHDMLVDDISTFNSNLDIFAALATHISTSSEFMDLTTATNNGEPEYYIKAKNAMDYLAEILALKEALPIEELYIYLPKEEYIMSSSSFTSLSLYYSYSKNYNDNYYSEFLNLMNTTGNYRELIPIRKYTTGDNIYLYKLPLSGHFLSSSNPNAYLIMELTEENVKEICRNSSSSKDGILLITNKYGEVIFHAGDALFSTSISADFLDNMSPNPNANQKINGKYYRLTIEQSSTNQWIYYWLLPTNELPDTSDSARNFFWGIIIFTLFITIITIIIISRQLTKPVLAIDSQLKSQKEENETLHSTLDKQLPYVANSYLASIFKGRTTDDTLLEEFAENLGIPTKDVQYVIMYMKFYSMNDNEDVTGALETFETILKNRDAEIPDLIQSFFGSNVSIYRADISELGILISFPEADEPIVNEYLLKNAFDQFSQHLKTNFTVKVRAAVSNRKTQLAFLWEAYQQAREAFQNLRDDRDFLSYREMLQHSDNYYYPLELATQLTDFIREGKKNQVEETFRILHRTNYENRTLSATVLRWLLSDIHSTLIKIRFTITETPENHDDLQKLDFDFNSLPHFDLLKGIALDLCELNKPDSAGQEGIISEIKTYIQNNYKDPSLSLKTISSEFHISESYFSFLFKEQTKQNFSEYLENLRMSLAYSLAATTSLPLSSLYLEVGYNNSNSFRRAFKKVYGISPKEVRDAEANK